MDVFLALLNSRENAFIHLLAPLPPRGFTPLPDHFERALDSDEEVGQPVELPGTVRPDGQHPRVGTMVTDVHHDIETPSRVRGRRGIHRRVEARHVILNAQETLPFLVRARVRDSEWAQPGTRRQPVGQRSDVMIQPNVDSDPLRHALERLRDTGLP